MNIYKTHNGAYVLSSSSAIPEESRQLIVSFLAILLNKACSLEHVKVCSVTLSPMASMFNISGIVGVPNNCPTYVEVQGLNRWM